MDIALDATRPFILHFILENVGNGVAMNINFNIEDEIIFKNLKKLSDYVFIRNGLKSLAGKTRYKTFLVNTMQEDLDIFKKLIIINIIYEDILKRKYKDKIIFDLSYLSDIIYSHTEPEHEVIKQLSDIATSLKSISKKINNG
jgi:hypothetical protein